MQLSSECWLSMHVWFPAPHQLGIVANVYNVSTQCGGRRVGSSRSSSATGRQKALKGGDYLPD